MKMKKLVRCTLVAVMTAVLLSGVCVTPMAFASVETPAGEAAEGYIDLHLHLDGAITLPYLQG